MKQIKHKNEQIHQLVSKNNIKRSKDSGPEEKDSTFLPFFAAPE